MHHCCNRKNRVRCLGSSWSHLPAESFRLAALLVLSLSRQADHQQEPTKRLEASLVRRAGIAGFLRRLQAHAQACTE